MKTSISFLHHQLVDWKRELDFYRTELNLLKDRLSEVVAKNTHQEILAEAEHFQNKLVLLEEHYDKLHDEINKKKRELETKAEEMPTHIHHKILEESAPFNEDLIYFKKSISEIRYEFNKYLAKVF